MNYYEVTFSCSPDNEIVKEILVSLLGDIGFESFTGEDEAVLCGYIPEKLYTAEKISEVIDPFPVDAQISFTSRLIAGQNWNEEWEKNFFQPIIIEDKCAIHSTFHKDIPPVKFDIIIDPKMSFGTGHHETTSLMINYLLGMDLDNKSMLDMGCGTAVLAILAAMKGAHPVTAIDNDEWAYHNSIENVHLNKTDEIQVILGDANSLGEEKFDIIIANINRNILLNDIRRYAVCMHPGSELYLSGFYTEDIPSIQNECSNNGLKMISYESRNNWAAVKFVKE